jgi:hypothetical protein
MSSNELKIISWWLRNDAPCNHTIHKRDPLFASASPRHVCISLSEWSAASLRHLWESKNLIEQVEEEEEEEEDKKRMDGWRGSENTET